MREFRGIRIDNGEWAVGNLYKYKDTTAILSNGSDMKASGLIYTGGESVEIFGFYPVIPETVGQYTGQNDIKGKKIYEGDIIHIESDIDDKTFDIPIIEKDGCFEAEGSGILFYVCQMNNPVITGTIHDKEPTDERA